MKFNFIPFKAVIIALIFFNFLKLEANEVIIGTSTAQSTSYVPAYGYYDQGWSSMIFKLEEIGATGTITHLQFQMASTTNYTLYNQKVYMKVISDSVFATGAYISPSTEGAVMVYDGNVSFTSSGGFQGITLQTSFNYTGGNLLILWENRDGSYSSGNPYWYATQTSSYKSKFSYQDGGFPTGTGSLYNYRPNTKLIYTPSYSNDLALTQWVYPNTGASASSSMPISVKVSNTGGQAQSNFVVKYSVNDGATWAQQTVTSSIATGASLNLTFITPANMSTPGLYKCIAVVRNTGDTITHNDTLRQNITICGGGYAGNYTVGPSSSDNFPDLNSAFDAMRNCGVTSSVILKIKPGTYIGKIDVPFITGLTATKTITIETYSGLQDVVFNYTGVSSNNLENYTLSLDSARFIKLKNLTIKASGSNGSYAILVNMASNNIVENCIIEGENASSSTSNYFSAINFNHVTNGYARQNRFINNTIKYGSYGIYDLGLWGYVYGNKFIGNQISDYRTAGIYISYNDSLLIDGNRISSVVTTVNHGIYLTNCQNNIFISNNKLEFKNNIGLYLYSCQPSSSYPTMIYNNWIYGYPSTANNLYGFYNYSSTNINFEHNSIYLTNPNSLSVSSYGIYDYYGSGLVYRNNSVVNEAGGYSCYFYSPSITVFDYNNLYTNGTYLAYYNGSRTNLASLQSGSSTNYNSVSTNGVYYSNTNLHSNSSGLNNLGSGLSTIATDIDGQTRNATTPDIGADEFDILNYDGGLLGFTGLTNQCAGTAIPIMVSFKNFGSQAITSAYIGANIGSAHLHQGWSGYLSPGSSTNIYLGLYTFSSDTVYNFVAYIDSVNHVADPNDYNDTTEYTGYRTSLTGSFIIGSSSNADFTTIAEAVSALNQFGVCGPVVFNIEPGTYSGNYSLLNTISGVSTTNTVTFRSLSGDTADVELLYTSSSTVDNYIFKIENTGNFKFRGLTFKMLNVNYNTAISLSSSTNISVDSCLILQPYANVSSYGYGIYSLNSNHLTVTNSSFANSSYGIYFYGNSSTYANGLTVVNNKFNSVGIYGVYSSYGDTIIISGNQISTYSSSNTNGGIYINNTKYYLDIHNNNIITKSSYYTYGIYLTQVNYSSASAAAQIKVYNNFVIAENTVGSIAYSFYGYYSNYLKVYYNTFKSVTTSTTNTTFYIYYGNYQTVVNNIIYSDNGYTLYRYYGSVIQSDYNDFYSGGTYLIRINSSTYTTLASYVSYYGYDSHSKSVNPNFIATNDLHIFNQVLNGAGSPISGITTDIDGALRSTTLPDIGADEFDILSRDVLPLAVQSPFNPAAIGQNPVKVSIKNQGTSVLYSANIFYRLDGGTIDSNYWVGSLGFLGIDSLINLGNITLTSGNHILKVWTKNPNGQVDLNPTNDTLLYQFVALPKPIIDFAPSIVVDTLIGCNGTLSESIKVYNRGSANLTITIPANTSGGDSIQILSILTGYYSTTYNNTKSIITTNIPNAHIVETSTYDATTLAALLAGKDIVLIPRVGSTSSTVLNAYTAFGPALQNFVSNGGTVIFMGSSGTYANSVFNTGLFTGTSYGSFGSGYSVIKDQSSHPLLNGITNTYITPDYYYYYYYLTSSNTTTIASYSSYPVIAERTLGQGKAVLLGFDNYYISSDATTILVNAIEEYAHNGEFVVNSLINQTISAGDSTTINFSFNSSGLVNGWHSDKLIINHNDQSQPNIEVPCSLFVDGAPEIGFSKTSHSFGSVYAGSSVIDSIYFRNTGCDVLNITGVSSNNSYLIPMKISGTIAPGDSLAFGFKFQPMSNGSFAMAATVYNNDSNYVLNFAGTGTPSPAISFNPNPINVTITQCGDSLIVPVVITNTGGAVLTGNVSTAADSLEVLMLSYGAYSTSVSNMASALGYVFTKYNLTTSSVSTTTQLQTALQDKDVVIIPYISTSSYYTVYNSFATILQNFVSNGGMVIYGGQYYSTYLTGAGFFSGSYVNYTDYVSLTVNTGHPITTGLASTIVPSNESFLYYTFTNTGRTDLLTYSGYNVSSLKPYGDGYALYLGFYYPGFSTNYSKTLLSNALQFAYDSKDHWVDYTNYNFSINPGSTSTLNLKFKSEAIPTGQYNSAITFNTNIPSSPTVQLPCTLNVRNELNATSFLGPDTSYCGPKILNAGSGYSTYLWNTAATSQTLTANSSGFYMVTVTDGGVCSSRDTVLLTINPNPNAVISNLPTSACTNGVGIQMTGSPSGGGFIGTGVSGSVFYPANVAPGSYNITYTYTNSNGCTDSDVKTVNVYNPPSVLFSGLAATYCPQGTASSLIGAPSGGVFSGLGVIGSQFNPILAGSGNRSVIYSYTDLHGCTNSDTNTTTVQPYVQANITGYLADVCIDNQPVNLLSNIAGTSFTGSGISGNVFNPAVAGVGIHPIYYSYTSNGCNYQDTLTITVHGLPTGVSISGIGADYCYDAGSISLSGYPLGGVFSGTGVTGSTFITQNAGAGNHAVVYIYTDVFGCKNSDTSIVTINALPVITFNNINPAYCIDNGAVALSATPTGGIFAGNFVTGSSFNTSTAGVGSHYVNYSYTDNNGCFSKDSIVILVNGLPTVSFSGLPATSCSNGSIISLTGSPVGGVFTGNGMNGSVFNPANAGSGNKQITYSYTDNNGCTNYAQHTVNVVLTQQVNIGANQIIPNNTATQFNPIISGGTGSFVYAWSPSNKLVNSTILNPSTVALTQTTLFSLTVSDNNSGCIASDSALVIISGGAISVNINASNTTICAGDNANLQAIGSGGNGNYSFSWSSNPVGFTATSAQINVAPSVTTTYTCLVSDGTLNATQNAIITVNPTPTAQITNLNASYCSNEPVVSIIASPSGGVLSGSGISGVNFNPALASIGINSITYSVTGSNGCSDVDTVDVEVKSAPTANAGKDTLLPCQNNGVQLGQQPFTGVVYSWYPTFGLNNANISNPVSSPNYPITYIFTATAANGCQATDTTSISVIGGPNAIVSNDTMICAGETVTLNVSGGVSYVWSTGDTTTSIQVTPNVTTEYFVITTLSNCADFDTIKVTVNNPKPHLGKDSLVCAGNSILITPGIFSSYLWSTGSTNPFISVDSLGVGIGSKTISVEVTDIHGCSNSDTIVVTFEDCTGISEKQDHDLRFTLFPNPTKGQIRLTSTATDVRELNYSILDITGSVIMRGVMENNAGYFNQSIDLSTLSKGIYMIHLVGENQTTTLRITLQ